LKAERRVWIQGRAHSPQLAAGIFNGKSAVFSGA